MEGGILCCGGSGRGVVADDVDAAAAMALADMVLRLFTTSAILKYREKKIALFNSSEVQPIDKMTRQDTK